MSGRGWWVGGCGWVGGCTGGGRVGTRAGRVGLRSKMHTLALQPYHLAAELLPGQRGSAVGIRAAGATIARCVLC